MIKILLCSLVFFMVEAAILMAGQNALFHGYASHAPIFYSCQNRAQQLPTDAVVGVHKINASRDGGRIVLGGSSSQVFVAVINYLEDPMLRDAIHRGDTGSQKFWDSLRIIDNLDHPNSSAVLVLHPRKFLNSDSRNAITRSQYSYGLSGSFPINSQAYDRLVTRLEAENGVDPDVALGGGIDAIKQKLFFPLNFYAQAMRECVEETIDEHLTDPLLAWQATSKQTHKNAGRSEPGTAIEEPKSKSTEPANGLASIEDLPWKAQSAAFRKWLKTAKDPARKSFRYAESLMLLEELLATAQQKSIELIVVDAPLSEVHRNELLPHMPTFYDDVGALIGRFENAHYIRFDQSSVDGNMTNFIDALHLTADGWQKVYFDYLTEAITYRLDLGQASDDKPS